MSLEERDRRLHHVKKGKDLRKHFKDKENNKWAKKEINNYKSR